MKAILEFDLPESCVVCPIRYIETNTHRLFCGFGAVDALYHNIPQKIVAHHFEKQVNSYIR